MVASGLLRERDLRALIAVVQDGLHDDPGEAMPWAVFDRLQQLIPCVEARYEEFDVQGNEQVILQNSREDGERLTFFGPIPNLDPEEVLKYWAGRAEFLPYRYRRPAAISWCDPLVGLLHAV